MLSRVTAVRPVSVECVLSPDNTLLSRAPSAVICSVTLLRDVGEDSLSAMSFEVDCHGLCLLRKAAGEGMEGVVAARRRGRAELVERTDGRTFWVCAGSAHVLTVDSPFANCVCVLQCSVIT